MALVVFTGRELTLTINSVAYSVQTAECTLTPTESAEQYITLTGTSATKNPATWELNVRAFADWGEAVSFCDNMVTAAAAGTPISFTMGLPGSGTATGTILPMYPPVGGAADAALEVDMTFPVKGSVTFT